MSDAISAAYSGIQDAILNGRYPPGTRLRERELADALGVSRTPVREALRQLAADGYVTLRLNAGATVAGLTPKSVMDLADFRAHLADMMGRLAAVNASSALHERLDALAHDIARVASHAASRPRDAPPLFRAFHRAIAEGCGNEWLARAFNQTTFVAVMHATYEDLSSEEWSRIAAYYPVLTDALRSGDAELCGALMRAYFIQAKQRLRIDRLK